MKRQLQPTLSIQDFEQAADSLIRIMFDLTEQHIEIATKQKKSLWA